MWLEAERLNLLEATRQAAQTPGPVATMVGPLAAALFRYLQMGGYWNELKDLNQAALQVARDLDDRPGQAQALSDLATACWWLRDLEQAVACNRQSLQLRRALGDRRGESLSLGNLSQDYIALGQLDQALACQHQSLAIIRDLGDHPAEARALNGLGGLSDAAGRFDEAVAWYEQALGLFRQVGDRASEGTVLGNLTEAQVHAGRPEEAIRRAEAGVTVCRQAGNRHGEATCLQWLGSALDAIGHHAPGPRLLAGRAHPLQHPRPARGPPAPPATGGNPGRRRVGRGLASHHRPVRREVTDIVAGQPT